MEKSHGELLVPYFTPKIKRKSDIVLHKEEIKPVLAPLRQRSTKIPTNEEKSSEIQL